MEQITTKEVGPAKISFSTFLLKLLAAGTGGTVGSLILLIVFVVFNTLLDPLTGGQEAEYISPVFVFILMIMVFLSSTVGNLLSVFLISLTERDKYKRTSSALYQVFSLSLIIFLLMVPVYFITAASNASVTAYAIALHIIISAQTSALILEIVSNYRYALVGVYGVTFSILLSAAVIFGLNNIISSPVSLLFVALPVVWGSMAFVQTIVTMLYGWLARIYDKDFLSTQTVYGDDYGKDVEEEISPDESLKDESGADFLRKQN